VRLISAQELDHDGEAPRHVKRRFFTRGRRLWSQLNAWPWSCWPNGRPPGRWHRHGDPQAAAVLQRWLDKDLVFPGLEYTILS
jgi:hypothetical protein